MPFARELSLRDPVPVCVRTLRHPLSCRRPLTRPLSHHLLTPLARSLEGNYIGDQGASALAAVLKETKITKL